MLRILTYHRVSTPSHDLNLNPRLISATPEVFAHHMRHLAGHYDVVSMLDVLESLETGRPLPDKAVLITFDDAYRDFMHEAWPILRMHRLPVTLFVPTDYPDHPERTFWWDRLYRCLMRTTANEVNVPESDTLGLRTRTDRFAALVTLQQRFKALQHHQALGMLDEICETLGVGGEPIPSVLNWDELRHLARDGVTLAAHTCSHPLLTRVTPERIRHEVVRSQEVLRREIGCVLPVFSYPDGAHDDRCVEILRQEGFVVAVTQLDGHNDLRKEDHLRLNRTNITRKTTLPLLRLRLQTWFTHIDRWRHRQSRRASAA